MHDYARIVCNAVKIMQERARGKNESVAGAADMIHLVMSGYPTEEAEPTT
jgi:hypothetical protein